MSSVQFNQVGYGLSQALIPLFPAPIVSNTAAPTSANKAQIGTLWITKSTNAVYIITSIVDNFASWILVSSSGGAGDFASLLVTPGPTVLDGAFTTVAGGNATSIAADAAVNSVTLGSATGASHTIIQGGTAGVSVTGSFMRLSLPTAPINVYTGAGAPSGTLATEIGDLYVNTTAASATTRMYIATAVGTWTNFTTAA